MPPSPRGGRSCSTPIPAAEPARAYLKSRDFPESLAEEFGLGYAPEGVGRHAELGAQGRLQPRGAGNRRGSSPRPNRAARYDFFRGRLMIPIHDEAGQVVAFSGRLLDPEAKAQKYVNSPETPIFVKSRILFGLNKTKRPIIEADSAILCEGQIDLMRCWQKGVRNVVAPQGTAFTDQQARILKRLAKEVVICFDADSAGQNAAQRSIDVLLKEGRAGPHRAHPAGRGSRQPSAQAAGRGFREHPARGEGLHAASARHRLREEDIASPRGRGAVAQKMAQVIAKIPNAVQREGFLLEVARRLQVARSVLEEEVRKAEVRTQRRVDTARICSR